MATRSTICLVLKKEDIGKFMKFDINKIPKGLGYDRNEKVEEFYGVGLTDSILQIYHHWDGYPSGVGATLLKYFNDYDSILNLLLGGDASTINPPLVIQYYAGWNEDWNDVKPKCVNDVVCSEEYVYKFDDGVWFYKGYGDKEWKNLSEYLKD